MAAGALKTGGRAVNINRIMKILLVVIPLSVAGNIIYIVIASEPDILGKLANFRAEYLLLTVVMVMAPWMAHVGRMLMWSRVFRRRLTGIQAFKTALAADIGAATTPTFAGGGYAKLFFLVKYGFTPGEATLLTILTALEDAVFFGIALPVAVYMSRAWNNPHVVYAFNILFSYWPVVAGAICAVIIGALVLRRLDLRNKRKRAKGIRTGSRGFFPVMLIRLRRYRSDLLTASKFVMKRGKGTFLACVLVAGIGWIGRYGAISALVVGLGYSADPVLLFLLQWVVFTTMTMIPTPGAVGGAELSFGLIHAGLLPFGLIPILTGAWRFLTFYMTVAVGAIFLAVAGPGFPERGKRQGLEIVRAGT
jgi:uncharacterized protein (TIRG00374 family)